MKAPISPYIFRHLFSAEVKRQGTLSEEEKALALGHLAVKTQQVYGSSCQASKKHPAPTVISAWAPSPVRGVRADTPKTFTARFR